jgi:hypothetical protein
MTDLNVSESILRVIASEPKQSGSRKQDRIRFAARNDDDLLIIIAF